MSDQQYCNEMRPEFLGLHSMNSFSIYNSSSRNYMFASHFSQRLVVKGLEERICQSGLDHEFAKYTFNVRMPENGRIIKIIPRYPVGVGQDSLNMSPETIVIYENEETKEIDYFSIPYYASFHQFFGYKYKVNEQAVNKIRTGAYLPKNTIFADSPGVSDNGNYMFGVNLNTAFMSIPAVSEDGIMISSDVLDKLKFRVYETRVVEFGSSQFPLNIYGNSNEYKAFPDIGDMVRDDGILMMLRSYDNDLMPVEMSIYDAQEPDFMFDKAVYVKGGGGRVVDIRVITNNSNTKMLPELISANIDKYSNALLNFYKELLATEEKLRYERKRKYGDGHLNVSRKLHRLLMESLAIVNHNTKNLKQTLNLLYRKAPIDEYRIEFVVEYEITPDIGYKLSDTVGGKYMPHLAEMLS